MRKSGEIALLLGFFLTLTADRAWSQQAQQLPVWQPTEAQSKLLGSDFFGKGWSVKPPLGLPNRVKKEPVQESTTWASKEGGMVVVEALGPPNKPIDQGLNGLLAVTKSRSKNFNAGPAEYGQINGKTFIRARYSCEGSAIIPGTCYGFIYLTYDTPTPFVLMGFGSGATIEKMEAAAMTFRYNK